MAAVGVLRPCPSQGACQWTMDEGHMSEYSHPCPARAACNQREDPHHCRLFTHPKRAAPAKPLIPRTPASIQHIVHRGVRCDGCGADPIRGFRYKCMFCPDYDLCDKCSRNPHMHNVDHPLIRFTATNLLSPCFQPRSHIRHSVACDVCRRDIVGVRYMCTVDGTSLCEACEFKGVHDPTHARLKMSVPTRGPAAGAGAGAGAGGAGHAPLPWGPWADAPAGATPHPAFYGKAVPQGTPHPMTGGTAPTHPVAGGTAPTHPVAGGGAGSHPAVSGGAIPSPWDLPRATNGPALPSGTPAPRATADPFADAFAVFSAGGASTAVSEAQTAPLPQYSTASRPAGSFGHKPAKQPRPHVHHAGPRPR